MTRDPIGDYQRWLVSERRKRIAYALFAWALVILAAIGVLAVVVVAMTTLIVVAG